MTETKGVLSESLEVDGEGLDLCDDEQELSDAYDRGYKQCELDQSANEPEVCVHQFLELGTLRKSTTELETPFVRGVECICALCTEVRVVWEDGKIKITGNGK